MELTDDQIDWHRKKAAHAIELSERSDIIHEVTISPYWIEALLDRLAMAEKVVDILSTVLYNHTGDSSYRTWAYGRAAILIAEEKTPR